MFISPQSFISTRYIVTRTELRFANAYWLDVIPRDSIVPRKRATRAEEGGYFGVCQNFPTKLSRRKPRWKTRTMIMRLHGSIRARVCAAKSYGGAVADSSLRWSYNLHLSDRRFIPSRRRKLFPPFPPGILLSRSGRPSSVPFCGRAREPLSAREDREC